MAQDFPNLTPHSSTTPKNGPLMEGSLLGYIKFLNPPLYTSKNIS